MNKKWTPEEDNMIALLKNQGLTYKQMVEFLPDRNERTISVRAYKILPNLKKLKSWTPEEENTLIEMRAKAIPYKDIAEHLGRTYSSVKTKGSYLITSASPRPASKTSIESKKVGAFSDLTPQEAEYIETGQTYLEF